jgi:hypothetical protein
MTWYTANTGRGQGLVVDEETGENIAVVYDKKNEDLIAAAPELLKALEFISSIATSKDHLVGGWLEDVCRAAINKALNKEE